MDEQGVIVLGIPVPSSDPAFLAILAVHVAAGLLSVIAGIVAMLAFKGPGRHSTAGSVYFWSLLVVFLTMSGLSVLRWPHNNHLFALGFGSLVAGAIGRRAHRRMQAGWVPVHVSGMAISYILLLIAFYVDNGPHLPFWRSLPPATHWLLPCAIGLPLLVRVLRRHPLIVARSKAASAGRS